MTTRRLLPTLLLPLLLHCGIGNRYPSLEFGYGVSLAWPHLAWVSQSGDTVVVPWTRVDSAWTAIDTLDGARFRGALEVRRRPGASRRWTVSARLDLPRQRPARAWFPLLVAERLHGFFDFSTGEALRFAAAAEESVRFFQLQPGEAATLACGTLAAYQPISGVLCIFRLQGPAGAAPQVCVRRQPGRRTKRRYDLRLGWKLGAPASSPQGRIQIEVLYGQRARQRWERLTLRPLPQKPD